MQVTVVPLVSLVSFAHTGSTMLLQIAALLPARMAVCNPSLLMQYEPQPKQHACSSTVLLLMSCIFMSYSLCSSEVKPAIDLWRLFLTILLFCLQSPTFQNSHHCNLMLRWIVYIYFWSCCGVLHVCVCCYTTWCFAVLAITKQAELAPPATRGGLCCRAPRTTAPP